MQKSDHHEDVCMAIVMHYSAIDIQNNNMNPYSTPLSPIERQQRSSHLQKNPARILLYVLAAPCILLAIAAVPKVSTVNFPLEAAISLIVFGYGATGVILAVARYSPINRSLTICWCIAALFGLGLSFSVDPPYGELDTFFAAATVFVVLCVGGLAVAYRSVPTVEH